jgi:hypothetical protein
MNRHVYNACMLCGWALISAGAGLVYLPAGLITAGALLLVLTLFGARMAAMAGGSR